MANNCQVEIATTTIANSDTSSEKELRNENSVDSIDSLECIDSKSYNDFVTDIIKNQCDAEIKVKQEIIKFNSRILTFIYDKFDQGHNYIYDYKFRDYLLSIGFDLEHSNELINYLLDSADGSLDLEDLKVFFNLFTSSGLNFRADMYLSKLLNSSLMPSFLDTFKDPNLFRDNHQLSQILFNYLNNHRFSSQMINEPYIENIIKFSNLKQRILFEIEKSNQQQISRNKSICIDQECFQSLKVCCSKSSLNRLIDGKSHTFWQANSSEKCEYHYVVINLRESIKPISLSIYTIGNRDDEFLKLITIEVKVGTSQRIETIVSKCDYVLTIGNQYELCNFFPNDQSLSYIKITFKRSGDRTFSGLKLTSELIKIKSIKLTGKKEVNKASKITVQDASVCWYFEMLSSMALVQSQLMPNMYPKMLNITKNALKNIPPLSLTTDSKNSILTQPVLEKVNEFLNNFLEVSSASIDDKSDAILIYLLFNLARCNLKYILSSILIILENHELRYEFSELMTKINEASESSLRKFSYQVNLKVLKIESFSIDDNALTHENESELNCSEDSLSEIVLHHRSTSESESSQKSCENDLIKYNILLATEQNVTLTDINLKIKLDSMGIKSAIIFLIFSKEKPNISKFDMFDEFTKEKLIEYKSERKHRENISDNQSENDFDFHYYEFYNNQADVLFELPMCSKVVNYILIKFYKPKDPSATVIKTLNIASLKVFGCKHSDLDVHKELKYLQNSLKENDKCCQSLTLTNAVLVFLSQLVEQHRISSEKNLDSPAYLNFEGFDLNDLWKIYDITFDLERNSQSNHESASDRIKFSNALDANIKIPVLVLFNELVGCNEIRLRSPSKDNAYQYIFYSICKLIDNESSSNSSDSSNDLKQRINYVLEIVSKQILKNGIVVFFPNEKTRQECFLQMVEKNSSEINNNSSKEPAAESDLPLTTENKFVFQQDNLNDTFVDKLELSLKKESIKLLFESFCSLFCSSKSNLIKNFTSDSKNFFDNPSNCNKTIDFINKIFRLSFQLNEKTHTSNNSSDTILIKLNELLNSIQSNLFYLIRDKLASTKNHEALSFEILNKFIIDYSNLIIEKTTIFVNYILNSIQNNNENVFVNSYLKYKKQYNTYIYNFVHWISEIFGLLDLNTCTKLMRILLELRKIISQVEQYLDESGTEDNKEIALKSWTFNSKLISSIKDLNIMFSYPLAHRFEIEFDKLSNIATGESSSSSDNPSFNFTDSNDHVRTFSGKLKSNLWPDKMEIYSNSYIQFVIRSPNSKDLKTNLSFFLKFTITAYGYKQLNSQVLVKDIIYSLTNLFGTHLSRVNAKRFDFKHFENHNDLYKSSLDNHKQNESTHLPVLEHQLSVFSNSLLTDSNSIKSDSAKLLIDYNSELYRILLRGGKFEDHSRFELKDLSRSEYNLIKFLHQLIHHFREDYKPDKNEKKVNDFLRAYSANQSITRLKLGGAKLDKLIVEIFCVLCWHNPYVKYENIFDENDNIMENKLNSHILKALKVAASTRMYIIEKQQKYKTKKPNEKLSLIEILSRKALYLLKFKRLSVSLFNYERNRDFYSTTNNNNYSTQSASNNHNLEEKDPVKCDLKLNEFKNRLTLSDLFRKLNLSKENFDSSSNLVIEYLFDKNVNDIDQIEKILEQKIKLSKLIQVNLELVLDYLSISLNLSDRKNLKLTFENILIFLSSYFNTNSLSLSKYWPSNFFNSLQSFRNQFPQTVNSLTDKTNTSEKGSNSQPLNAFVFPPQIKSHGIHYLENLYACGIEQENQLRDLYHKFLRKIINIADSNIFTEKFASTQERQFYENLKTRINSFTTSLLSIDWDVYDWKFVYDINLIGILLKNASQSVSIANYLDVNNNRDEFPSTMDVLEDIFNLSLEKFEQRNQATSNTPPPVSPPSPASPSSPALSTNSEVVHFRITENQSTSQEEAEKENKGNNNEPEVQNESFDMKFFPKMYQHLFQVNGKNYDTEGVLKALNTQPITYDQYQKFLVSRYMSWKYYSKLKTNIYCENCDTLVFGNRYICLDCHEYHLCFNCFSKSSINSSSTFILNEGEKNGLKLPFISKTHLPSHRMLLIDHVCNQCGSLIVGKRLHCEECYDYDLCLMCSTNFNKPIDEFFTIQEQTKPHNHKEEHKTKIVDPTILVAKPDNVIDAQIYLSLSSHYLFSILSLKLSMFKPNDSDNDDDYNYEDDEMIKESKKYTQLLLDNSIKSIIYMLHQIYSTKNDVKNTEPSQDVDAFNNRLKLFVTYSQENLFGLLSCIIKKLDHKQYMNASYTENFLNANCIDFEFSEISDERVSIYQIISFLLNILYRKNDFNIDEINLLMMINILSNLLLRSDPDLIDTIVRNIAETHKSKLNDSFVSLLDNQNRSGSGFSLLHVLIDWIDQSIQNTGASWLYMSLIHQLNSSACSNPNWKNRINEFLEYIFTIALNSTNPNNLDDFSALNTLTSDQLFSNQANDLKKIFYSSAKVYNLFYAISFIPNSMSLGQWVEYRNQAKYDGAGILKSKTEYKYGLLKSLIYNTSSFNLCVIDPVSRRSIQFKDFKYDYDFREPVESISPKNHHPIDLNKSLIEKLIKSIKNILTYNKLAQLNDINVDSSLATASKQSNSKLTYEEAYIEKKKQTNSIIQQLPMRKSLLLFSFITLFQEHVKTKYVDKWLNLRDIEKICRRDDNRDNKLLDSQSFNSNSIAYQNLIEFQVESSEMAEEVDEFTNLLFDSDLLNWLGKFSVLNTNVNAYWEIAHLNGFLFSLLLREGFINLHNIDESAIEFYTNINQQICEQQLSKKASASNLTNSIIENESNSINNSSSASSLCSLNVQSVNLKKSRTSKQILNIDGSVNWKRSQLHSEQSLEDLKLNLKEYSLLGLSDPDSSTLFNMSDMISKDMSLYLDASKACDLNAQKRHKRSLKLAEDCIEKLCKYDNSTSENSGELSEFTKVIKKSVIDSQKNKEAKSLLEHLKLALEEYRENRLAKAKASNKTAGSQLQSGSNTSMPTHPYNPIRNSIKVVTNAVIVLLSRNLVLSLVNLSSRYRELSLSLESLQLRRLSPFTSKSLNCDNEFELMQLLDVLFYTDNSLRYKLFVRNLISSLIASSDSSSLINRICLASCELMMPEYKMVRKVSWSPIDGVSKGKLKAKNKNESLVEENNIFPTSPNTNIQQAAIKQMIAIENGSNLGIKPNDVEKLSTYDTTKLIMFDMANGRKNSLPREVKNELTSYKVSNVKKFVKTYRKNVPSLFSKQTEESKSISKKTSLEIESDCKRKEDEGEEYFYSDSTIESDNEQLSKRRKSSIASTRLSRINKHRVVSVKSKKSFK